MNARALLNCQKTGKNPNFCDFVRYMFVGLRLAWLTAALLAVAGVDAFAANTQARLLLAQETAQPGDTVLAGIHLHMNPGWHTYWKNSGQSGLPTEIDWQLPTGVTAGAIQWPVPKKVPEKELTTYVLEDDAVLLVPLKLSKDLPLGLIHLKAKVDWLECKTECIKDQGMVEATITLATETKASKDAPLLDKWRAKLPQPADAVSPVAWWGQSASGNSRPLVVEWTASGNVSAADFYPESAENFEVDPATEKLSAPEGKVRLRALVKKSSGDWPKKVAGLLIEQSGNEQRGYEAGLAVAASGPSIASQPGLASASTSDGNTPPLWRMFLYALLGGLLLNVMPCVLPVIALKILGFVSEAKNEPARVRKLGLIYTAGVLSSFLVLALIVVALQSAGKGAGWGFQFGNPYFLVAMTTLVTLIALNLFGVFEITLGSGTLTAATTLASKQGAAGAFFNGLLATVLATSCSAPFLGAAIGFAFALSKPAITVLILLTVGAGLALPYLLLSFQPAWLRLLPKPGPWMERFKVAMGFPMLAVAAWLCSILAVSYGDRAWWMVMFLVFVAIAAWIYGEFVQRVRKHPLVAGLFAAGLLILGYFFALENKLAWRQPLAAEGSPSKIAPRGLPWQPWSPEAVAEARASGRPVVVDFTAKWCPTCNTIVKPTFENAAVQRKLKEINAVPLLADYTRFPENITAELKRFKRAAVPLVLVYPRDPEQRPMVFDLITPTSILDALTRAATNQSAVADSRR
jgi:thiol:disulfide interchange protein